MSIVNPSQARKVFYQLLKDVNQTNEPVHIIGNNEESETVMVSKKDWDAIQETLYLQYSGVANVIHQHKQENEFIAFEDINWYIHVQSKAKLAGLSPVEYRTQTSQSAI
ncbi:MAG: type II toxin-antitoxin system Phd/YefM family antitoxin [Carnobacterium sp.]|uniref:type II toxin-antitoxin system Phd/YefM family antitoxin n=1 Tax=Carnobacterium sp. TaxID=48221 RepID=UPI003315054D